MSYIENCSIPAVWCGKGNIPSRKHEDEKYYIRRGTPYECMKVGIGAGIYSERKKDISSHSLQNIKYIGDVYENNFKKENIHNLEELLEYMGTHSIPQIKKNLIRVFTKKGGIVDQRAYNSTLMFVYKRNFKDLPPCFKIRL